MTKRKKKLLIIQITLALIAIFLFYISYYKYDPEKQIDAINSISQKPGTEQEDKNSNKFENIKYKGIDLNGNRYIINSKIAEFNIDNPEIIYMKIVSATFYFKDDTILYVNALNGIYNNKTNDMNFEENVEMEYQGDHIYSDNLDYINTESLINVYGNIKGESIKGDLAADKLQINIKNQTIDISMFDNDKINVTLKNK